MYSKSGGTDLERISMNGVRVGSKMWLSCQYCKKEYDLAKTAKSTDRQNRKLRCPNCNRIIGVLN